MGELMDDPNRQAVGLEPAWVEGSGASTAGSTGGPDPMTSGDDEPEPKPKARTKAELLEEAAARGIDADESMTKAELEEALGD